MTADSACPNCHTRLPMTLAGKVQPDALRRYLEAHGWQECPSVQHFVTIYRKGEEEVQVPLEKTWADYPRRIFEAARELGEDEGRSAIDVLRDLTGPPLSTAERLIWASSFSACMLARHGATVSAREATRHVLALRCLDEIAVRSICASKRAGASPGEQEVWEAVQAMRGEVPEWSTQP